MNFSAVLKTSVFCGTTHNWFSGVVYVYDVYNIFLFKFYCGFNNNFYERHTYLRDSSKWEYACFVYKYIVCTIVRAYSSSFEHNQKTEWKFLCICMCWWPERSISTCYYLRHWQRHTSKKKRFHLYKYWQICDSGFWRRKKQQINGILSCRRCD